MEMAQSDPIRSDGFIAVSGHRLKIRWLKHLQGDPQRPVMVFLHEGLGSIDLWEDFPDHLVRATGLDALLYDRLGHGQSDSLEILGIDPDYQNQESFKYLPALLEYFDLKRCVLVGHSDGGTISLLYTSRFPRRVAAIVTEAAHVFVDHLTTTGIRHTMDIYRAGGRFKEKLAILHGAEKAEALVRRWSQTWLDPRFADWNVEHILPQIRCPVMALQGADDEYGLPEQAQSIASKVGGHGEVHLIPGCRHTPHHQSREAVVDHILRLLGAWQLLPKDASL
jgi:pimeloyl-ACP methyl ester carboxylesterase